MEAPNDMKNRLKASYDAIAGAYNTWTEQHSPLRLQYLDKLFELQPSLLDASVRPRILELGCGAGLPVLSTLLSRNEGSTVVANDMSTAMIDLARENVAAHGDRVDYRAGDMTKLEFKKESLAAVIGLYSIIHLPQEEQVAMLKKIGGWLEEGGCLLGTFQKEATKGTVEEEWIGERDGWMFWSSLGEEGLRGVLAEAGMSVELEKFEQGDESFLWVIARKK